MSGRKAGKAYRGTGAQPADLERESQKISGRWVKWLLTALVSWLGLSLDLTFHGTGIGAFDIVRNWLGSFSEFNPGQALLIPGLYLIFRFANSYREKRNRGARWFLAAFFALNMVLGFAFEREESWRMLLGIQNGQLVKAVFVGISWFIVFENLLVFAFHALEEGKITAGTDACRNPVRSEKLLRADRLRILRARGGFRPVRWYTRMLRKHPFGTPFWTLLILFTPCLLISYPAMFMGDTGSIIVQAYSELRMTGTDYLSPLSVLREGVYINQHHPAFYTLALHAFLLAGDGIFQSLDIGVFLYCLAQSLLMIFAFSYAVSALVRQNMKTGYCVAILVYILVQPQIHNYLVLVTKEGPYTACFLLLMTCLFRLRCREKTKSVWILLVLSVLGVILLRNEGRYVLLLSGILTALADRRYRKRILGFTAAAMIVSVGIYQGLYISLGYTPGSVREMLSVPFQQTARFVRDYPEEVSAEEKEAINGVLEYDSLAEVYVEGTADPVKFTFREEADTQDLLRYFQAWFHMLIRHPDTYIQATYGNYDQYLYPGAARMLYYTHGWMENILENTNEMIRGLGKSFSLPEWNRRFRTLEDSFVEAGLLNFSLLSFLMTPAVYCWGVLTALCWTVGRGIRKNPAVFTQTVPAAVILFILLMGPTNGFYGRYLIPVIGYLPFMLLMLPTLRQREEGRTAGESA